MPKKIEVNLVLDIGKTNVKLFVFSSKRKILNKFYTLAKSEEFDKNINIINTDKIIKWLFKKIYYLKKKYSIKKLACSTHACGIALIGYENQEVMNIIDYESNFKFLKNSYSKIIPKFSISYTPLLENGLNIGIQLYYIYKKYPNILKKTKYILLYPQFITWKLTNKFSSEISYIGCHTHLWNFKKNNYSNLVEYLGILKKLPPINPAWKIIGYLKDTQFENNNKNIKVLNGIHDSNASYLYFKQSNHKIFTLISTGTWHIIINNQAKTSLLDPKYDMLCNIDIYGKKNPTIRFMGGREYEYLCSELKINKNLINSIDYDFFNYKKFLLPSFAEGGPFKLKKINIKKYLNKPIIFRYMLINSYIAFVMNFCLSKIKSNNKIIIDGPLAKNITILRILKDLRKKQEIYINFDTEGTVKGVNLLFNMKKKNHIKLKKIKTYSTKNLNFYYNLWLSKIKERKLLNN